MTDYSRRQCRGNKMLQPNKQKVWRVAWEWLKLRECHSRTVTALGSSGSIRTKAARNKDSLKKCKKECVSRYPLYSPELRPGVFSNQSTISGRSCSAWTSAKEGGYLAIFLYFHFWWLPHWVETVKHARQVKTSGVYYEPPWTYPGFLRKTWLDWEATHNQSSMVPWRSLRIRFVDPGFPL